MCFKKMKKERRRKQGNRWDKCGMLVAKHVYESLYSVCQCDKYLTRAASDIDPNIFPLSDKTPFVLIP